MITNADLTIYNKRGVNKKTARTIYLKTQIRGVNFYTKQVTNVRDLNLLICIRFASHYQLIHKENNTLMQICIRNYPMKKQFIIGRSTMEIYLEKGC